MKRQCPATLRSANGGITFYCTLKEGHKGEHYNEGPLQWWFDDGPPPKELAATAMEEAGES